MKNEKINAWFLTKYGDAQHAFELREIDKPVANDHQVLIRVESFGLNFADIMARRGLYDDCPKLPAILGYDVVGTIKAIGKNADKSLLGKRVAALTRFGGYAEYVVTDYRAIVAVPEDMPPCEATALGTQYLTAYYSMFMHMNLQAGDRVLIHAAAGGVGTALTQLAKHLGCVVYGNAGSENKLQYLKENGVDYPINYRQQDYEKVINNILGKEKLQAVFNPIGGKTFKKDMRLIGSGGTLLLFGASQRIGSSSKFMATMKFLWDMGLLIPIMLVASSKTIAGVNMLRVSDYAPSKIQYCLNGLIELYKKGVIKPHAGGLFPASKLAEAHELLESRQSTGKIALSW